MVDSISTDDTHAGIYDGGMVLVDVRDEQSHAAGHVTGAVHLTNEKLPAFLTEADKQLPVVVCCYHGNISQQVAQYLSQQGFAQVYSMNGGFEEWRTKYPEQISVAGDGSAAD
jgi:thiosulfate sulfurtransferase